MPVARHTPDHKRRVRTGCLTCRKRRRKCDERKPKCQSCETKNFVCKYPEVTFVTGPKFGSREAASGCSARPYTAITFVEQSLATTPPSKEPPKVVQSELLPTPHDQPGSLLDVAGDIAGDFAADSDLGLGSTSSTRDSSSSSSSSCRSKWEDYFCTNHASSISKQTAMLLHFQYNLVPWISAGDPASHFGTDVMLLAQEERAVLNAVLAVASSQLALLGRDTGSFAASKCGLRLRQEAGRPSVVHEGANRARQVSQALLALGEFFSLRPSQWTRFPFYQLDEWAGRLDSLPRGEPMLETLLHLHLRIDLAASLLTEQPPLTPLSLDMCHDMTDPTQAPYTSCLAHLASCLHLLHGSFTWPSAASLLGSEPAPPLPAPPLHANPSGPYSSSTTWSSLWTSCQQWYQDRPLEMQPILEIRSVEAGQIDTESDSSFPISLYTSSIALQCNAAYHITSRLLLSRKPRLLKLSSRQQRCLASQSWHAQQIAGIATRNDFAEQWDPILVAGLLWIARDMTHPSQQEALLGCFRQVTANTGIRLDEEVQTLRERWHVSRTSGQLGN